MSCMSGRKRSGPEPSSSPRKRLKTEMDQAHQESCSSLPVDRGLVDPAEATLTPRSSAKGGENDSEQNLECEPLNDTNTPPASVKLCPQGSSAHALHHHWKSPASSPSEASASRSLTPNGPTTNCSSTRSLTLSGPENSMAGQRNPRKQEQEHGESSSEEYHSPSQSLERGQHQRVPIRTISSSALLSSDNNSSFVPLNFVSQAPNICISPSPFGSPVSSHRPLSGPSSTAASPSSSPHADPTSSSPLSHIKSPSPPPYSLKLPDGNAYKSATWEEVFRRVLEILKREKMRQKVMAVEIGFSGSTLSAMLHNKYKHTKAAHVARLRDWCYDRDKFLVDAITQQNGLQLTGEQVASTAGVDPEVFSKFCDFTLPITERAEVDTLLDPWLRAIYRQNLAQHQLQQQHQQLVMQSPDQTHLQQSSASHRIFDLSSLSAAQLGQHQARDALGVHSTSVTASSTAEGAVSSKQDAQALDNALKAAAMSAVGMSSTSAPTALALAQMPNVGSLLLDASQNSLITQHLVRAYLGIPSIPPAMTSSAGLAAVLLRQLAGQGQECPQLGQMLQLGLPWLGRQHPHS